jgi:transcriptional regulator with GAF, ATPase, and Fis domain
VKHLNRAILYTTIVLSVGAGGLFVWIKDSDNEVARGVAWATFAGVVGVWMTFVIIMFLVQTFLRKPWEEREALVKKLEIQNEIYQEVFSVAQRVAQVSSEAHSVERAMQASVETLREELKLEGCSIRMHDPATGSLLAISGCGYRSANRPPIPLPANSGVAGKAISERRPIFVEDVSQEKDFIQGAAAPSIKSLFCIPLVEEGQVVGVLSGSFREIHRFNPTEKQILALVSSRLAALIHRYGLLPAEQRNLSLTTGVLPAAAAGRSEPDPRN